MSSEHAPQKKSRVETEEEIFFDDWRPESDADKNKENERPEDTTRYGGVEMEDVVMKGAKSVRFGVPELALGGRVVGVSGESLVDVSDEEWDEAASANLDEVKMVGKRAMTPGGERVGEGPWLRRMMRDLADEELGDIDFRLVSEKDWSDILCGVGVVGKLATIHLAALLEDEGYEVDATREEEMKIEGRQMVLEGWRAWNGGGMWEEACIEYRSMMEEKDTEDVQEILEVLEAKERVELEAERELDLSRMDQDIEI